MRVDASEVRAKVIGEVGNLGLTPKARVEFAPGFCLPMPLTIQRGVDCSDHEVNIKILLSGLVTGSDMTDKQRVAFLASMTDEVDRLCWWIIISKPRPSR